MIPPMTKDQLDAQEEITDRGWWVLERYGCRRAETNLKTREVCVEGYQFRHYMMGDGTDYFLVFRPKTPRAKNGRLVFWSENYAKHISRRPNYSEWEIILNALRRMMILEDLADV